MIYFIQVGVSGPIKIGYTSNSEAQSRLDGLQTSCPWPLRLIGTIPGEIEDERRFHRLFRRLRTHGEWFLPDQEIFDFIGSLLGQEFSKPEQTEVPAHDILNGLPSALYEMAQMLAADAKVTVAEVLIEAVRDGLKASKPHWDALQKQKIVGALSRSPERYEWPVFRVVSTARLPDHRGGA